MWPKRTRCVYAAKGTARLTLVGNVSGPFVRAPIPDQARLACKVSVTAGKVCLQLWQPQRADWSHKLLRRPKNTLQGKRHKVAGVNTMFRRKQVEYHMVHFGRRCLRLGWWNWLLVLALKSDSTGEAVASARRMCVLWCTGIRSFVFRIPLHSTQSNV